MRVAVLDYGMGNLRSVAKALDAAGADSLITSDRSEIDSSDALCVPGQGIFGRCIESLGASGMDEVIRAWIGAGRPYLGICLGMQILFERSDEAPDDPGLSLFGGHVGRLPDGVTVPHMGWNSVDDDYFYFDHSYAVHPSDQEIVTGWCEHGERFAARIESGSVTAVQFHPEKSSTVGIELLSRWVAA